MSPILRSRSKHCMRWVVLSAVLLVPGCNVSNLPPANSASSGGLSAPLTLHSQPCTDTALPMQMDVRSEIADSSRLSETQNGPSRIGQMGLIQDWSTKHAVYARSGSMQAMLAAQRDPRAFFSWRAAVQARATRPVPAITNSCQQSSSPSQQRDWSISLGTGTTAPSMYPAKYTFDINATPSCANDFVVFPVNATGGSTQSNIVAFNNLYSGTVPANGICNRTPSGTDNGTAATVLWSYAVTSAISGGVLTSPVLSLDGTRVAFIESGGGQQPHFHVLAWKRGDGVDSSNLQNALLPKVLNTFTSTAPIAGSGTATDLAFGGLLGGDTLSSPFVDYGADKAYVGDDSGNLVRIQNVFCTVNPACSGPTPPAPSIDASWGTSGTVIVGLLSCAGSLASKLSGPVEDIVTGNVFVGCGDGKIYGFNSTGASLTNASLTVGNGTATGGVVDPPIVDGVNGSIYAVSGNSASGNATLVQAKTDLSSPRTATLRVGGLFKSHAPVFNDAYFSSPNSANWLIYAAGFDTSGNFDLFGVGFDASRNMNSGTPANVVQIGAAPACEYSPLTEFLNGATDWLFGSILCPGPSNIASANITTFPGALNSVGTEGNGTSGFIVDNASTQAQASSFYFGTEGPTSSGGNMAVKLTQVGLR